MQIYDHGNTNYNFNGDQDFSNVEMDGKLVLNGEYDIVVYFPYDSENKWKIVKNDNVIKCNTPIKNDQLFRIYNTEQSEEGITAYAKHVFFDLEHYILMDVRPTMKDGQQALSTMLNGTPFTGTSNISTINTAYYVRDNILQALSDDSIDNSFVNRWGGERLYDNYNISINSHVGENRGVCLELGYNIDSIKITVDDSSVVTRIIPEAYNGILLEDSKPYVDSELIDKYAVIHSKVLKEEFADLKLKEDCNEDEFGYETLEELRAAMKARCKKLFEEGIDKPKLTAEVNMIGLKDSHEYIIKGYNKLEEIKIGDTIDVWFEPMDIDLSVRIKELNWTLDEEENVVITSIVLGDVENSYFNNQSDISSRIANILSKNGVKAESIEGVINALQTKFKALRDVSQTQHVRAFKFEDDMEGSPTYGCMVLGTSGFEIANEKDANGDWIFRTFGSGQGFVADEIVAGVLKSILIQNMDGSFKIDLSKNKGCDFYSNGNKAISIFSTSIDFFNYGKAVEEIIGTLATTLEQKGDTVNPDKSYISLFHSPNSMLSIGYQNPNDDDVYSYMDFDTHGNGSNNCAITFFKDSKVKNIDLDSYNIFFDKKNYPELYLSCVYDSKGGSAYLNGNAIVTKNFECFGDKNCIQKTKKFGNVKFSSIEDIGAYLTWREYDAFKNECIYKTKKSKYNQDGYFSCIVKIPEIVQECIDTTGQYDVSINVIKSFANAKLWSIAKDYFLVKSDKPCRFNFVLTGRRKGFETRSLEEQIIEGEKYKLAKNEEYNDLIIKKAKFKLLGVKRDFRLWKQCGEEWKQYGECLEG